jgi:hypothetical protein
MPTAVMRSCWASCKSRCRNLHPHAHIPPPANYRGGCWLRMPRYWLKAAFAELVCKCERVGVCIQKGTGGGGSVWHPLTGVTHGEVRKTRLRVAAVSSAARP